MQSLTENPQFCSFEHYEEYLSTSDADDVSFHRTKQRTFSNSLEQQHLPIASEEVVVAAAEQPPFRPSVKPAAGEKGIRKRLKTILTQLRIVQAMRPAPIYYIGGSSDTDTVRNDHEGWANLHEVPKL